MIALEMHTGALERILATLLAAGCVALAGGCGDDSVSVSASESESETSDAGSTGGATTAGPGLTTDTTTTGGAGSGTSDGTTSAGSTGVTTGGTTTGGSSGGSSGETESTAGETTSGTSGAPNQPPVAVDDTRYATQDVTLLIPAADGVLINDEDPDGDPLTVVAADESSVAGASVMVAPDGGFSYEPPPGFSGCDRFGYTIEDSDGASDSAEVTVLVHPTGELDLAEVASGVAGFAIDGEGLNNGSGSAVSGLGDMNGDGRADVLVGARWVSPQGVSYAGRSYVVLGPEESDAIALADVAAGDGGFAMDGEQPFDYAGFSVGAAGDINGDGVPDVVVGAWASDANANNAGRSYVVFGQGEPSSLALAEIAGGAGGFALDGELAGDFSGVSVSGVGDVNGDGLDDVLIGAFQADPNGPNSGRAYVVFGKQDTELVALSQVAQGVGGFRLDGGAAQDFSGVSVAAAGDVNGDGLDDVLVAGSNASPNGVGGAGQTYVVFGKQETDAVALDEVAAGAGGFAINGEAPADASGFSVGPAGDVNGDGVADVIIGAFRADINGANSGRAYVVFGKQDDTEAIELSAVAQGDGGFAIDGEAAQDYAGWSVSGAGDINGDGLDDLVIGAHQHDAAGQGDAGRAYLVFGKIGTESVSLAALGGGGLALNGETALDLAGFSVKGAGDVNGDGLDDVIIGAYGVDANGESYAGRSYVVLRALACE